MLASLDNEVVFKKAFTDKSVFKGFVKDILGLDIEVEKIETEKKFSPKIGNIDFTYDIFAETTDHRVIVEIQKVDYDYNFDRFLHYHYMAIAQLQESARDYRIDSTVYTIVFLTAPYKIDDKTGRPVKDEVLISSADPRNLRGEVKKIYGHQLLFLNPSYKKEDTPGNYLDWLNLIYESIHHPKNFKVNLDNQGIKRAVNIIDYEKLTPEEIHQMKVNEGRKATLIKVTEERESAEKRAEEAEERADDAELRTEKEKKQRLEAEIRLREALKKLKSFEDQ